MMEMSVRRALRAIYAPPADAGYWDALEARILARVMRHGGVRQAMSWWEICAEWLQAGAIAAALACAAAGLAATQTQTADARVAYEAVVESVPSTPQTAPPELPAREAAVQSVLSSY